MEVISTYICKAVSRGPVSPFFSQYFDEISAQSFICCFSHLYRIIFI